MIGQKIKQLLAIVVASMSSMMVFMSLYNVYVTYQITVEAVSYTHLTLPTIA